MMDATRKKLLSVFIAVALAFSLIGSSLVIDVFSQDASANETKETEELLTALDDKGATEVTTEDTEESATLDETSEASSDVGVTEEVAPIEHPGVTDETQILQNLADDESFITVEAPNAYVMANDQIVTGKIITVPTESDFVFTVGADTGFAITEVKAYRTLNPEATFNLHETDGEYRLDSVDLSAVQEITIKVEAEQIEVAPSSEAQPIINTEITEEEGLQDEEPMADEEEPAVAEEDESEPAVEEENDAAVEVEEVVGATTVFQSFITPLWDFLSDNFYTVTFEVEGQASWSVTVSDQTLVDKPTDPTPPGAEPFHAWYAQGATEPFNFSTPITSDLTLVADFSYKHLVTFLDTDGSVLAVKDIEDGDDLSTITAPSPSLQIGQYFSYWSLTDGGADIGTDPITSDVTLYPVIGSTTVVIFVTNGSEVPSQSGSVAGIQPTQPAAPTREGYTFSHWSLTPDGAPYNFNTTLTGTTYIYAVWTPAKVGYVINFYNEKAGISGDPGTNPANYELAHTKAISATDAAFAADAGSYVNTTADGTGAGDKIKSTIISTRSNYTTSTTANHVLDFSQFYWTDANTKTLSPYGDTVINVYAKRIVYTWNFNLTNDNSNASNPISFMLKNDPTVYSAASLGSNIYSVFAKLGEDVSTRWPRNVTFLNNSAYIFKNWTNYYGTYVETIGQGYIQQLTFGGGTGYTKIGRGSGNEQMKATYGTTGAWEKRFYYTEIAPEDLTQAMIDSAVPSHLILVQPLMSLSWIQQ